MRRYAAIFLAVGLVGGCLSKPSPSFDDPDPLMHIPAMHKAGQSKDLASARHLVKDLESDDPAMRLYAIGALERIAGQRFGYVHYQEPTQREASLERWRAWLKSQDAGEPGPATAAAQIQGVAP